MSRSHAPGSMAAHDALAAAVIALHVHALNCGMDPAEPDPAAWAARRAAHWRHLMGKTERPASLGRSISTDNNNPGGPP